MASIDVKNPEEMARACSDFVNNYNLDSETFCQAMANQHRTLQQSFTRLCLAWLKKCAELESANCFDLRNEAGVKLAKRIVDTFKDDMYLPLI